MCVSGPLTSPVSQVKRLCSMVVSLLQMCSSSMGTHTHSVEHVFTVVSVHMSPIQVACERIGGHVSQSDGQAYWHPGRCCGHRRTGCVSCQSKHLLMLTYQRGVSVCLSVSCTCSVSLSLLSLLLSSHLLCLFLSRADQHHHCGEECADGGVIGGAAATLLRVCVCACVCMCVPHPLSAGLC